MHRRFGNTMVVRILTAAMLLLSFQSAVVNAAMVATQTVIQQEADQRQSERRLERTVDKRQLLEALESDQLQARILALGVDPDTARERIANLTAEEISRLNAHLEETPAGGNLALAVLAVFVVFVITDAMCATDLFTFVKCVNN